jgi:hypothetical protein
LDCVEQCVVEWLVLFGHACDNDICPQIVGVGNVVEEGDLPGVA